MIDRELMQQAYAVPLHEQLASVPESARLVIDDPDGMGTRFIPVGRMCHEAAAGLRELGLDYEPVQEPVAWRPDVCPITGLPFFMWIEHHETGQKVPTYGGPYDSYTIPVRDKDGSYYRERYDHDLGGWLIDEVEDVGVQIVSDQAQPEQEPVALETVYETIIQWDEGGGKRSRRELARRIVALYTTPPANTIANSEAIPEQIYDGEAWRHAAIRVGEDLCSVGPFGYYDMTASQWLDWALSVVTVHTPPRREWQGLTDEEIWKFWWDRPEVPDGEDDSMEAQFISAVRAIEAKLKAKNDTRTDAANISSR